MSKEFPKSEVSFKQSFEDKWFALDALDDVEESRNLIQRANIQRNLASCTFHESIKLKHPSDTTCHLLQSDLRKYENLIHRSGQDVARKNSSIAGHLLMDDCQKILDEYCPADSYMDLRNKSWDVDMSMDRVKAYQLSCKGAFLCCFNDEISDDLAKEIFGPHSETIASDGVSEQSEVNAEPSSSKVFSIFNMGNTYNKNLLPPSAKTPNPIVQNLDRLKNKPGVVTPDNHKRNKWSAFQNSQLESDHQPDMHDDLSIEPIFPTKPPLKRRLENESIDADANTAIANPFKTGREVLHQQLNVKLGGNSRSPQVPSSESHPQPFANQVGPTKKSLGGRRNVQSKFVPPFLNPTPQIDQYDKCSNADEDAEMVDERLKHIDPKMVELIKNEIMDTASTRVDWSDIAGLEYAKATIKEAVVWPLLRPDIFTGLRRPPRGILLFGPPGTGKTMIGKCIASQSKSTFFSISASSLTSKWIGDGEKMVRALFAVASVYQPAVVFIDEIDSLLCQRSDSEHESSRRLKTEFLVQLDGAATTDEERILIVGATNRPQELDEAARRRLVKRLYIPLPELEARIQILHNLLRKERTKIVDSDIEALGRLTDGFSGADMKTLCHEASMGPIRSISMDDMEHIDLNDVRPVCYADFEAALQRVRSSVSQDDLSQYLRWDRTYGSGSGLK